MSSRKAIILSLISRCDTPIETCRKCGDDYQHIFQPRARISAGFEYGSRITGRGCRANCWRIYHAVSELALDLLCQCANLPAAPRLIVLLSRAAPAAARTLRSDWSDYAGYRTGGAHPGPLFWSGVGMAFCRHACCVGDKPGDAGHGGLC